MGRVSASPLSESTLLSLQAHRETAAHFSLHRHRHASATTLRIISLSPRHHSTTEEQSRSAQPHTHGISWGPASFSWQAKITLLALTAAINNEKFVRGILDVGVPRRAGGPGPCVSLLFVRDYGPPAGAIEIRVHAGPSMSDQGLVSGGSGCSGRGGEGGRGRDAARDFQAQGVKQQGAPDTAEREERHDVSTAQDIAPMVQFAEDTLKSIGRMQHTFYWTYVTEREIQTQRDTERSAPPPPPPPVALGVLLVHCVSSE